MIVTLEELWPVVVHIVLFRTPRELKDSYRCACMEIEIIHLYSTMWCCSDSCYCYNLLRKNKNKNKNKRNVPNTPFFPAAFVLEMWTE